MITRRCFFREAPPSFASSLRDSSGRGGSAADNRRSSDHRIVRDHPAKGANARTRRGPIRPKQVRRVGSGGPEIEIGGLERSIAMSGDR